MRPLRHPLPVRPAAALLVLLLGGCGDAPDDATAGGPDPRAPGTVRMADLLREMAAEADPRSHPYVSSPGLESTLRRDPPEPLQQRIVFEATLAQRLLHAGRTEESVERFEELLAELRGEAGRIPVDVALAVAEALATAHLRVWEREACVEGRETRPCLFPVTPAPGNPGADAARAAVGLYEAILEVRPDDLTARWLLNLSRMMLGEHPDGVPERFLIPPAAFAPEYDLPAFPDRAPELGLDLVGHLGGSVMDDFDGDGDLDLVASSWHLGDQLRLFLNEGDGSFTDATVEAGLEGIVGGIWIVQADYDDDGALDLLVVRGAWTPGGEPNSLLRNRGDGTFEDVTESAGLLSVHPTQSAAWGDYDGDGLLDLFVGNESEGGRTHPSQLYHNEGDGTFREVGAPTGTDVVGFVKGVQWGDYDDDGRIDLFLSRLHEPNVLLRNEGPDGEGGWRFTDVAEEAGVAEPLTSFPAWFWDYDNDGHLDLFVSGYRGTPGDLAAEYLGLEHGGESPRLYRNQGDGTFHDVAPEVGLDRVLLTMGSNFGDLDNDGWEDLYAGTGEANLQTIVPNRMFRNDGGAAFQEVTTAGGFGHIGKGHGVSFGDIDGDGDQDVHATIGGAHEGDLGRNVLFENPGHGRRWLTLRLEGVRSNRSAIGARVRVVVATADGRREIHRLVGTGGSFGANSLQQEIGLGEARAVERIEVRWPGAVEAEDFGPAEMDRVYRVREGSGEVVEVELSSFRLGGGSGSG